MTSASNVKRGPHGRIEVDNERDRLGAAIFDRLWETYRRRVSYVQTYEQVIASAGATFVNDHIAFRTFACQKPFVGVACVSRLFEALGYRAAGVYQFEDKHLAATHFQHANPRFPKLFISELQTWELDAASRQVIERSVASHRAPLDAGVLAQFSQLRNAEPGNNAASETHWEEWIRVAVDWIEKLPWELPEADDVAQINRVSQYAAWVLVHGYNVNHFTSLINSHGTESLNDIEKTIAALRAAGVPMKAEIEGERGSTLRQTATEAVMIDVDVRRLGQPDRQKWSYAYFELAERGDVIDPTTGKRFRFEGFLGPQATNLFEMTKL